MNKNIIKKFLAVLISTSTLAAFAGVAQAAPPKKGEGKKPPIAKQSTEDIKDWVKELDKYSMVNYPLCLKDTFFAQSLDEMSKELYKDNIKESSKKNGKYNTYTDKNGKKYEIYENKDLIKNKKFANELNNNKAFQVPNNNNVNKEPQSIYTDKSGKKYVISHIKGYKDSNNNNNKKIGPKSNSNNNKNFDKWQAYNQKLNANWKKSNNQIKEIMKHKQMLEKQKAEMLKKHQQNKKK